MEDPLQAMQARMMQEAMQAGVGPDEIIDVVAEPVVSQPIVEEPKHKVKPRINARKSPLLESAPPVEPVIRLNHTDEDDEDVDEITRAATTIRTSSAIIKNPFDDDRKLDKKKREALAKKWSPESAGSVRAAGFQAVVSSLTKTLGSSAVYQSEEDFNRLYYGIPVASIAFEYLIANDVLPLSAMSMIAGAWGSGKSALLYEIFRWTCAANGTTQLIDTELKADPELMNGLINRKLNEDFFFLSQAYTVEDVQQTLTVMYSEMKSFMLGTKEAPGPGRVFPFIIGVDSYAGAPAKELSEKIKSQGFASRGFSEIAMLYSRFLPTIVSELANWPFGLIVVNHLSRDSQAEMNGVPVYKTKGGTAVNFREGIELHMFKKKKIETAKFRGIEVDMLTAKNSFGPTGNRITSRLLSWIDDDPETGLPVTRFAWDWDYALVKLLLKLEGDLKKRLAERGVNLREGPGTTVSNPRVRMPALGMGKDEFLPYKQFGALLRDSPAVGDLLRDALNIKRRPQLVGPGPEVTRSLLQGERYGEE